MQPQLTGGFAVVPLCRPQQGAQDLAKENQDGEALPAVRASLRILLAAALLLPAGAAAARLDPALRHAHTDGGALSRRFVTAGRGGEPVANVLLEGSVPRALLEAQGIEINTWTPAGATARCPLSRLALLQSSPGILAVHPAARCRLLLDRSAVDADVSPIRASIPPNFAGQSGAGVLVGAVESGIDLLHGDFRKPDGSTRIVSLWDQTTEGRHPSGFTYGTEWTASDIDGHAATERDEVGHGTHVLGIAAGDGSSTNGAQAPFTYVGIAPEAGLCVVKTDLTTSGIVDGVHYIFRVADALGIPAVVNLSLGTQEGPHDGTLLLDRLIDELTGPGHIVVAAAGNEGGETLHAQVTVAPSGNGSMGMFVPAYTAASGAENDYVIMSGWYAASDRFSVTLSTPGGQAVGPVAPGDSLVGVNTPDGSVDLYNLEGVGPKGDHEIYFVAWDPSGSPPPHNGTWQFQLAPLAIGASGRVDAYIEASVLGDGSALAQWTQGGVLGGVVNAPGDADSVIAVAAYVTKVCWNGLDGGVRCYAPAPAVGSIARFSCQGPRRDGVMKPELAAPGVGIVSSRAGGTLFPDSDISPDHAHVILAGTSMSTPHVTGAVALYLAHRANAHATPSDVRAALTRSARADAFTGSVPNPQWGAGKLDVAAALGPALQVSVSRPEPAHVSVIGRPDTVLVQAAGGTADSIVVDLSRDGGATFPIHLGTIHPVSTQAEALVFTPEASWATYHGRVRCVAYNATSGDAAAFSQGAYLIQPELDSVFRAVTPNPSRGNTTIHFELLSPQRAAVRLFSARGTLVRTLADRPFAPGRYSVDWNGTDERGTRVAAGIYFCEFRTDRVRQVRRITLLW